MDPNKADNTATTPTPPAPAEFTQDQIRASSFEDILREAQESPTEEDKPTVPPATPPPSDDKSVTPPQTPPTPPPAPPAPAFDLDKLKAELGADLQKKISDETAARVIEAITGSGNKEAKDILANAPWKKDNRNPSWEEALDWTSNQALQAKLPELEEKITAKVAEQVYDKLNKEVEEEDKRLAAEKAQTEKTQADYNLQKSTEWDAQLKTLEDQFAFPKIVNRQDPKDPGVVARKNIFELLQKQLADSQANKTPYSDNLVALYHTHYLPEQKSKADKDPRNAPVSGARKSVNTTPTTEINYFTDVHNRELEDLVKEKYSA